MESTQTMNVNIDNKNLELHYSFRAYMLYENITDKPFQPTGKLSEFIILFYSTIMASDMSLSLEYDDFLNWLDNNPDTLNEFIEWLTENINKTQKLSKKMKETSTDEQPKN